MVTTALDVLVKSYLAIRSCRTLRIPSFVPSDTVTSTESCLVTLLGLINRVNLFVEVDYTSVNSYSRVCNKSLIRVGLQRREVPKE